MAKRSQARERQAHEQDPSTPAQQDEADILEELGAERDENGEIVVSEEKILEVGAVDAESVRENRRLEAIVNKKRANQKHVTFNTGEVLTTYDTILGSWPANTIDVHVRRLTGAPVQDVITSRPRSGTELFAALKAFHGQCEEAQYEVKFKDCSNHQFRGSGRITMPDTRVVPQQQGQPMTQPFFPPGYPPQYAPLQQAPAPAQPSQPAQPPQVFVQPPAFDPGPVMSMMSQMLQMFRQMQPPQPPPQQPPQPQPQFVMPPPPPQSADPAAQMAWMQQAVQLFQQMQPQPQPQPPPPVVQVTPPPAVDPMAMMTQMFKLFQQMQESLRPPPERGPGPEYRGPMYRGPRPYPPQGGDPGVGYSGPHSSPPQPAQQRPQTAAEQFRKAISVVRTAVNVVEEMNAMLPNQGQQQEAPASAAEADDDSPVQVVDMGPAKVVINKHDGSARYWESFWANSDKIFKWAGEQHEKIQRGSTERQRRQQPPQQLPPGYVEVGPGYQPPPGYVAVPVDPQTEQGLPPPPERVPPPIEPSSRQAWGDPTIPEGEH
jgi:hypothetical protein